MSTPNNANIEQLEAALERVELELTGLKVLRESIADLQAKMDNTARDLLSEEGYKKYAEGKSTNSQ